MELVYLWIEEYKNIYHQGFNFSPKFNCKYNKDTNELIIDENKDYIDNFFGDNINITAIVGKNGSGKSSILSNIPMEYDTFIIFSINNQLFFYNFDETYENIICSHKIVKINNIDFDFFGLNYDFLVPDFIDSFWAYFYGESTPLMNNLLSPIFTLGNSEIKLGKYRSIINRLIIKYSNITSIFSYNPSKIKFQKYYGFISEMIKDLEINLKQEKLLNTNVYELLLKYQKNIKENLNSEYLLFYIFLKIYSKNQDSIKLINTIFDNPKITLLDVKKDIFDFIDKNNFDNLKILSDNFDIYIDIFNKQDFFDNKHNIIELKEELEDNFKLLSNEDILNIIKVNFFNDDDIEFIKLSQGERQIYTNMLLIYDKIKTNLNENILIQLDEIDLTLHPQWQKKYINELIKLLLFFNNKKFHIIFTSHSPFIISDIPKQNIIFLDTDENGNCKVVDGLKEKKETFGANIHTLLSDSFFMKDGLMGEFAKTKIDKIIKNLNDKNYNPNEKEKEQIYLTIKSIGEPFLKQKLLDMYYKKYPKSIDDEIIELEKRLKELKNVKS